jgi:cell wall-associated NlpC family hydrolase
MNNYQAIKGNIQPGDILLSRDVRSPISTVIGGITHSCWSHTFIYIGDNKIIDAIYSGVKIRPLDDYFQGEYALGLFRYITSLTPEQQIELIKAARKFSGLSYGWFQLGWQLILRLLGKSEDPDWGREVKPGVICSELVAKSYDKIGIRFKNIPPYQMEPVDFDESPFTVRIA